MGNSVCKTNNDLSTAPQLDNNKKAQSEKQGKGDEIGQ